MTTFELPGCKDMWTVHGGGQEEDTKDDPAGHAFLILSRPDSTMVLQTGQEINELDRSGFHTAGPTVLCGNVGDGKMVVQVCHRSARLLRGSELVQEVELGLRDDVARASLMDPHVLLVSASGEIALLTYEQEVLKRGRRQQQQQQGQPRLSLIKANLKSAEGAEVEAACVYKDLSGLFTTDLVRFCLKCLAFLV